MSWRTFLAREAFPLRGCYLEVWAGAWKPTAAKETRVTTCDGSLRGSGTIIIPHHNGKKKLFLF